MQEVTHISSEMTECIERCLDCYATCRATERYLIEREDVVDHTLQRLLQDCAEICRTSADMMLRGSDHHKATCGVCAAVCRECADACETGAESDAVLLGCAKACQQCAESCELMSN